MYMYMYNYCILVAHMVTWPLKSFRKVFIMIKVPIGSLSAVSSTNYSAGNATYSHYQLLFINSCCCCCYLLLIFLLFLSVIVHSDHRIKMKLIRLH